MPRLDGPAAKTSALRPASAQKMLPCTRFCLRQRSTATGTGGTPPVPQPNGSLAGRLGAVPSISAGRARSPGLHLSFPRPIEKRICGETATDFAVCFRISSRFVPEPLTTAFGRENVLDDRFAVRDMARPDSCVHRALRAQRTLWFTLPIPGPRPRARRLHSAEAQVPPRHVCAG